MPQRRILHQHGGQPDQSNSDSKGQCEEAYAVELATMNCIRGHICRFFIARVDRNFNGLYRRYYSRPLTFLNHVIV